MHNVRQSLLYSYSTSFTFLSVFTSSIYPVADCKCLRKMKVEPSSPLNIHESITSHTELHFLYKTCSNASEIKSMMKQNCRKWPKVIWDNFFISFLPCEMTAIIEECRLIFILNSFKLLLLCFKQDR